MRVRHPAAVSQDGSQPIDMRSDQRRVALGFPDMKPPIVLNQEARDRILTGHPNRIDAGEPATAAQRDSNDLHQASGGFIVEVMKNGTGDDNVERREHRDVGFPENSTGERGAIAKTPAGGRDVFRADVDAKIIDARWQMGEQVCGPAANVKNPGRRVWFDDVLHKIDPADPSTHQPLARVVGPGRREHRSDACGDLTQRRRYLVRSRPLSFDAAEPIKDFMVHAQVDG
jgi:hypothetical protein